MPLQPDTHDLDATRFCTAHTLAAAEPLAGTGAHQARNILIRWPKGRWAHSLRVAAAMPADLVAAVEAAAEAGWRVNLIDRKPDQDDCILVFPAALRLTLPAPSYPAAIKAIVAGAAIDSFAPCPTPRSCIFVCTHGKHDACCAKWGFAAYKALARAADTYGDHFDLWEITHLGGCRLSGGALILPQGRKYGRLVPADAEPLLAAEVSDLPYLTAFRGTNALSAPAQVAEITALKHLPLGARCNAITELEDTEQERVFAVQTTAGIVTVRCQPDTVRSYGACSDLAGNEPIPSRTIWRGDVLSVAVPRSPSTDYLKHF